MTFAEKMLEAAEEGIVLLKNELSKTRLTPDFDML